LHDAFPGLVVAVNAGAFESDWCTRLAREDFYDAVVIHPRRMKKERSQRSKPNCEK